MKLPFMAWICCVGILLTACKPSGGTAWIDFGSTEGKFRASYPVQPRERSTELKPAGMAMTMHSMGIGRKDGREYAEVF